MRWKEGERRGEGGGERNEVEVGGEKRKEGEKGRRRRRGREE